MLVTEPVRSGQRIFAEAGDLVVVGAVGSGAEVVASGNIHIYGALRGRALAGATGDAKARIFCHSLDAELVAVAGTYRTNDDIDAAARKQRAQVFLRDDALCIEPLK
jgi:septum site-determining protein MinC